MTVRRIRVLVVDDSAFARKVVREVLASDGEIEVIGIARDGLEALELIEAKKPDVITLDLTMPNLDGLGVLRALRAAGSQPAPRCVIVSTSDEQSDLAVQALVEGAVDVVHKPTALATDRLYDLASDLVAKVKAAFPARPMVVTGEPSAAIANSVRLPRRAGELRAVVIATSTGGPQALTQLLTDLPRDLPVPVAMVLHIPVGYTASLAKRLDETAGLDVVEAHEGLAMRPGLAILARAGRQMQIVVAPPRARTRTRTPEESALRARNAADGANEGGADPDCIVTLGAHIETAHVPSADVLFESAAKAYGGRVLGVVLTGMGQDGLQGARAIRAAGGMVFSEAATSCVVYGMPRSIFEAGLSNRVVPLRGMAEAIAQAL
jgi:two-component system chemotaxis response regulator CheB